MGYEYIAITDHSKAKAIAHSTESAWWSLRETVRRVPTHAAIWGFMCFSRLECDILKEGELDIEWDALAELDMVIASVHSHMNLEPAAMTDRLMRTLECPHVTALGHPTGRLLLHRDPFPFDFDKVADEAAGSGNAGN